LVQPSPPAAEYALIGCVKRPGCAIGLRPWIPKNPLELLVSD
jgi:hypothetical protein